MMITAPYLTKSLLNMCRKNKLSVESDGTEPTLVFKSWCRNRGLKIKK